MIWPVAAASPVTTLTLPKLVLSRWWSMLTTEFAMAAEPSHPSRLGLLQSSTIMTSNRSAGLLFARIPEPSRNESFCGTASKLYTIAFFESDVRYQHMASSDPMQSPSRLACDEMRNERLPEMLSVSSD